MKRGLSSLDPNPSARAIYSIRQEKVRDALRRNGVDAGILYADISTGADIAYLTHATLYWSYGAVLIVVDGPTVLLPGLSPRTEEWFSANGVFDRIVSSTDIAGAVRDLAVEFEVKSLGLIDSGHFPAALREQLCAVPGLVVEDEGPIVREQRQIPDIDSLKSFVDAARLGAHAIATASDAVARGETENAGAEAEYSMRMGGAWDASAIVEPSSEGGGLLSLRCQVRDGWYAAARHLGDVRWKDRGVRLLDVMRHSARKGGTHEAAERLIREELDLIPFPGVAVVAVTIEFAADIEPRYRMDEMGSFREGQLIHMEVDAWSKDGASLIAVGDVFRVGASEGTLISSL